MERDTYLDYDAGCSATLDGTGHISSSAPVSDEALVTRATGWQLLSALHYIDNDSAPASANNF